MHKQTYYSIQRATGEQIMSGDSRSMRIVFRNLAGENFKNRPVWQKHTHRQYLSHMEREYGPLVGQELSLFDHAGKRLETAHIAVVEADQIRVERH